jgi:hypothetical protein
MCHDCKRPPNTGPPFINGLLPVPPPISLNLPIVRVRYDASHTSPIAPCSSYCTFTPFPAFPSLSQTPSLPPCPSFNVISAFSYVKLFKLMLTSLKKIKYTSTVSRYIFFPCLTPDLCITCESSVISVTIFFNHRSWGGWNLTIDFPSTLGDQSPL